MSLTSYVSCFSDTISSYRVSFFYLLELVSFDELDLFNDESGNNGSGSGFPDTYAFPFCSRKSVGSVRVIGSGNFVLTGIESIGDVVPLFVFVAIGVESKGGRLIELFWRLKY